MSTPTPATGTLTATSGARPCNPFILQVGVYNPESGYRFNVSVELACGSDNSPSWMLIFDLYKKQATGDAFDQLVHVSFRAGPLIEQQAVQDILANGVTPAQASAIQGPVYQGAKDLATDPSMTAEQKAALHTAISSGVLGVPAPAPVTDVSV